MSNSSSTTTTNGTIEEYDLPPYDACVKPSYTKQNIEEFKERLQGIEEELLNIKPNDIRKPQLRRQAADLEEIIINFENTKHIPEIVQSLNDNIELLSEYDELEEIINLYLLDSLGHITPKFITENNYFWTECPRNLGRRDKDCGFEYREICRTDISIFIKQFKEKLPIYSNSIEKICNEGANQMFSGIEPHKWGNLLNIVKSIIKKYGIASIKRREEIKPQLNFNKKLSSFIENIIGEKKQMEDKITELDNKVNTLIKHCNKYAMPSNPLVMD